MTLADLLNQATPGPWTLGFDDGSGRGEDGDGIYVRAETEELAANKSVVAAGCDDWGVPHGVLREAGARLIALAPDMAQLLIDMAEELGNAVAMVETNSERGAPQAWFDLLARFAALDAKAGETP